ncbi:unnamed protein product, partial [Staurois parvus]
YRSVLSPFVLPFFEYSPTCTQVLGCSISANLRVLIPLASREDQGRTDHLETRALPEGPRCPWYLFHRLF